MVVFYAAGNSGKVRSTSQESSSKNSISVAASETSNVNYIAYFSSQGPSYDNRIKPDITAPGDSIVSANAGSSCGTTVKSGAYELF